MAYGLIRFTRNEEVSLLKHRHRNVIPFFEDGRRLYLLVTNDV